MSPHSHLPHLSPITYYLLECSDECAQGDGSLSFNAYRSVSSSPPIAQYCNVVVVHFKIHTYFHLTAFRSPFSKYIVILTVFCQKRQNDDIFLFIVKNSKIYNFYLIFSLCRFFHFFAIFLVKYKLKF